MIRVIIESPYGNEDDEIVKRNLEYLKRCIMDSLKRGEAPFASHGFYPQVLRDSDPTERKLGIEAGFAWHEVADMIIIYTDYGITEGMRKGIKNAQMFGIHREYVKIGKNEKETEDGC